MWAECEPKTSLIIINKAAKFEEIGAEFGVFKSNAPGLKLNFCEPYVDMPSDHPGTPRAVGNTWCTRHMAKPRPQVGRVC